MRFRKALILGAVGIASLGFAACEGKKQTEYVTGISTQVRVPRDLKTIRVDVNVGGALIFCRAYKVYDGKVQLPRSLGQLPATATGGGQPITVTVVGFTDEVTDGARTAEFDCQSTIKVGENARVLRRSRQPYVPEQILFLPMALRFSCWDVPCETEGQDKTCKAGRCVDSALPEKTLKSLPEYRDELLDGTGGACFHGDQCMTGAAPVVVVDSETCTYALPNTPSAPAQNPPNPFPSTGEGLNVVITYDGGYNKEILDKDEDEGFFVPDPQKPQQFRLAPGLCDLVKGVNEKGEPTAHRITAIAGAGACQSKLQMQPLCQPDQFKQMGLDVNGISTTPEPPNGCTPRELKPASAILTLLADNTANSSAFYNGADKAALNLSLSDPAFKQTEVALGFFPGDGAACTAASSFAVAPEIAKQARTKIADEFSRRAEGATGQLRPLDTNTDLDAALTNTYAALSADKYKDYYRRAVLVLGNRGFEANACGPSTPVVLAQNARTTSKIDTYVIMLANNTGAPGPDPAVTGGQLATAGGTPQVYDGRTDKGQGATAFQRIVKDIATCVYEVPSSPDTSSTFTYNDPVLGASTSVSFNAGCNAEGATASGWGIDTVNPNPARIRVRMCGEACENYRSVLETAAAYGAQTFQPALAVPVFVTAPGCSAPK